MAQVARPASELIWKGVSHHEPERLPLLLDVLRRNTDALKEVGAEGFLEADLRCQLVEVRFRRVAAHAAGKLDHEVRLASIPIKGSSDVAVPVPHRRELRVESGGSWMVIEHTKLTFHRELRGSKSVTVDTDPALFHNLVEPEPEPRAPVQKLQFDAMEGELPERLSVCLADVLQDHMRMHVLCSAEGTDPKPLVIDKTTIYQHRKTEDCTKWRTFVHADIHGSSISCACFLSGKDPSPGRVRFSLSFCGRCVEDGACPTHTGKDNEDQPACLANFTAGFFCVHADGSPGAKCVVGLADKPALPALLAIASAAVLVAENSDLEDAASSIAEGAVEEASIGLDEVRPASNELRDKRALHAVRTRMAIRKPNGRLNARSGQTPPWLSELSQSYGHLFPSV